MSDSFQPYELSITNSWGLPKSMSIVLVMPSSHLILFSPLLFLPSIPPSIRVFSNESTLHMRWSKYWSFRFSIIPSKEIPGLISFRMDWMDLLAVQGTNDSSPFSSSFLLSHRLFFFLFFLVVRFILENVLGALCYVLSHSVLHYPLWPHGLWPTRLLCPWTSPGNNTGVGCHFEELMLLNCGIGEDSWESLGLQGEDSWESLGLQGDWTSPFWRRSTLGFLWKQWC